MYSKRQKGKCNIVNKISKIIDPATTATASISGQGMDRRVEKQTPLGRKVGYAFAVLLLILLALGFMSR